MLFPQGFLKQPSSGFRVPQKYEDFPWTLWSAVLGLGFFLGKQKPRSRGYRYESECRSIHIHICICAHLDACIYVFTYLSLYTCVYIYTHTYAHVHIYLSVYLSIYLHMYTIYIYISEYIYLFIFCLSIHPSIHPSICSHQQIPGDFCPPGCPRSTLPRHCRSSGPRPRHQARGGQFVTTTDHILTRILQAMASGIPLVLGLSADMWVLFFDVVVGPLEMQEFDLWLKVLI